ncbi:uncharacterized protein VTP21DRAFT_11244 [Calcarisporiella thermophila]|uniref:uncharacterized protein n=1 Tax=Calcarisporiella thermophila TaxID=911321 RepID=UPI003741EC41
MFWPGPSASAASYLSPSSPEREQERGSSSTARQLLANTESTATTESPTTANPPESTTASESRIRLLPLLDGSRSFRFDIIDKRVPEGVCLRVGRFTERSRSPTHVAFRSKVVSRGHAEIWTEGGKFYIRDTKSSSGTFLNHTRLSPPGVQSQPFLLRDGDVIQLGVDYQGGRDEIYRCVKMRVELNRDAREEASLFKLSLFENLVKLLDISNLGKLCESDGASNSTECCICLYAIGPFQALFVAPCSHSFHYKCIRPLLVDNHPQFQCPMCRTYVDLEASVEVSELWARVAELKKEREKARTEIDEEDESQKQPTDTHLPEVITNDSGTETKTISQASTSATTCLQSKEKMLGATLAPVEVGEDEAVPLFTTSEVGDTSSTIQEKRRSEPGTLAVVENGGDLADRSKRENHSEFLQKEQEDDLEIDGTENDTPQSRMKSTRSSMPVPSGRQRHRRKTSDGSATDLAEAEHLQGATFVASPPRLLPEIGQLRELSDRNESNTVNTDGGELTQESGR